MANNKQNKRTYNLKETHREQTINDGRKNNVNRKRRSEEQSRFLMVKEEAESATSEARQSLKQ